ncbi:hypothetical protein RFI_04766 [Reticulomyxa filosa]|uniref:Uncharacterized protein n=1 Tax=Reticulomyxa filosa TaxID=46433 RepID=X6P1C1_RETFI|nr:hypothetical protein RFI_04766 [Reticulomyxa filosa]|eukprot:ETO32350.1 hypothetical protein RFI_04766 [Reticulomyxa filosa]
MCLLPFPRNCCERHTLLLVVLFSQTLIDYYIERRSKKKKSTFKKLKYFLKITQLFKKLNNLIINNVPFEFTVKLEIVEVYALLGVYMTFFLSQNNFGLQQIIIFNNITAITRVKLLSEPCASVSEAIIMSQVHTTETVTNVCPTFENVLSKWNWKEIKNCPGRYVLRNDIGTQWTPKEFIEKSFSDHVSSLQCEDTIALAATKGTKDDSIILLPFKDKGGILTYIKKDNKDGSIRYVHTLNSPSGMLRKLSSLHVSLIFSDEDGKFHVQEEKISNDVITILDMPLDIKFLVAACSIFNNLFTFGYVSLQKEFILPTSKKTVMFFTQYSKRYYYTYSYISNLIFIYMFSFNIYKWIQA